jgi:NADPH-dependent curcumin reductase CurA
VTIAREIHLASRPVGWPTPENFRLVETELPPLGANQVLVRNSYLSVDPYMRGRMDDAKSYIPPFALDAPMEGGAVGEVVESTSPDRAVGDLVLHSAGWRDHAILDADRAAPIVDPVGPASHYLGALGMPGLTAYAGLVDVAALKPGDGVFISGAAGAVGSMAGQLARLLGASRVVGSAGSEAKVAYLKELGFDAAFSYRDGNIRQSLRAAAPDGIDVYFDNVGGDHLEAALSALKPFGRVAMCGAIARYNETEAPAAPRNLTIAIGKQLTLRGFLVGSHEHLRAEYHAKMADWLRKGEIRVDETIVDGLDQMPEAFLDMLRGANTGKMIIRL